MTRRRSRMIESARTIQVPATSTRARAIEKRYLRLAARIALRLWHEVPEGPGLHPGSGLRRRPL